MLLELPIVSTPISSRRSSISRVVNCRPPPVGKLFLSQRGRRPPTLAPAEMGVETIGSSSNISDAAYDYRLERSQIADYKSICDCKRSSTSDQGAIPTAKKPSSKG